MPGGQASVRLRSLSFAGGVLAVLLAGAAAGSQVKKPFVTLGRDGALAYEADARGNRIPDFSSAGYRGGGVPLPSATARVIVVPADGDDGGRIQAAIDFVARLPMDTDGMRGAVLLATGRFEVAGQLRLDASGVVLQGTGAGENETVLVAAGTGRRTLIEVGGRASFAAERTFQIIDDHVPVGGSVVTLESVEGLRVGERVRVERPSTKEWISAIGMDDAAGRQPFDWKPGTIDLAWDRAITSIDGRQVTLDAPLTTALEADFGGGTLSTGTWTGRIARVGVENVRCVSEFDPVNPKDEAHAWMAVTLDDVEDGWVADVTAVHFASSTVQIGRGARAITVQDCISLAPVSELGGYRRHSFHTQGQQTLFLRCRAEEGMHDFTTGYLASGPNAFVDCRADRTHGFSGGIGSWASGVLFDNVHIDGASLDLDNLETWNQGVGWAAVNSVIWQSSAAIMKVRRPPTANNWAVGPWAEFWGDGWWDQVNEFVRPDCLYVAQLAQRKRETVATALESRHYAVTVAEIPTLEEAIPNLAERLAPPRAKRGRPLELRKGWLVANDALLTGREATLQWWRGTVLPTRAAEHGPALTRFAPGRTGPGQTDNLEALTDDMVRSNQVALRHHYGLWYDRRRDDHERVRRASAEVWPPFFEQPFARSGRGEAWDRLSRYDLTRYNPWYFGRLRDFAGLAWEKGLVLVNEMYFQHNILEAGAHWADSPWRPANSLQDTGFPEPPPYTDNDGNAPSAPEMGKRIFMAEAFYDVTHPVHRELHRAYIRQCLANLAGAPNVIHTLTSENSGPLHFMEFWLDVAAEWMRETGRRPLLALSAPKDVQEAILSDPERAALVDVIDLTYWFRTDDGAEFAPPGGTTLAPRQHLRLWRDGRPSAFSVAGMVREYRDRFPDKAVITGLETGDGWAFVAAGGSLAGLPASTDPRLLAALAQMQPAPAAKGAGARSWVLGEPGKQSFVYAAGDSRVAVDLTGAGGSFAIHRVDLSDGSVHPTGENANGGGIVTIPLSAAGAAAFWLTR